MRRAIPIEFSERSHSALIAGSYRALAMALRRHHRADRRQRIEMRVATLKRRFGIASVLGFGALFGLVTQHVVGSQKHKGVGATSTTGANRSAGSFFDANGPGYAFDDSGFRAPQQQGAQSPQPPQSAAGAQRPVAQSGGS
jgi:hypothetical protein